MPFHVQSRKVVHMSGVHGQVHASSTSGRAFVYFTVQCCMEHSTFISSLQCPDTSIEGTVWSRSCYLDGPGVSQPIITVSTLIMSRGILSH